MMDDQDLEERLKAFRPAGPPADLRARLAEVRSAESLALQSGGGGARAFQASAFAWLPAAAAMLLAATLYWLAASGRERVFAQLPAPGAGQAIDLNLEMQP